MNEDRKQFNDVLIGGNGCGKTTLQFQIAMNYLEESYSEYFKTYLKRILFLIPDDAEDKLANVTEIDLNQLESFVGIKKIILDSYRDFGFICDTYKPIKDELGNRVTKKFNGLFCCDDLGTIMNRRPEEILKLFKRRRQPNIDFLWAFHGLRTEVPPAFYTYVNRIILFRTSDNHEPTLKALPEGKQELFMEVYRRVQKISEKEPHYCEEIEINPLNI